MPLNKETKPYINIGGKVEYPWFEAPALHSVRSTGCSLLWAAQTDRNHHGRSLSTTINDYLSRTLKKDILQYDNAWLHVVKRVETNLETLKWKVPPHPPFSPDIASSDYHLFRSMAHSRAKQHFPFYEDVKKWVDLWWASKDMSFFRHGIQMLPER